MLPQRTDADAFVRAIDELRQKPWLGESRKWWPKYVIHFTDIQNAIKILNGGSLKSRAALANSGGIPLDIAEQGIIGGTRTEVLHNVRLYFKPRTPMQYRIEGFRPNISTQAHCPVPVVFLFGSKEVLSLRDSKFSTGNLGSFQSDLQSTIEEFRSLPFESIYHDFPTIDRNIIRHRQAEVIVPGELPLDGYLKTVWCRSKAELDTLIQGLDHSVRDVYRTKIGTNPKYPLFYDKWTYISDVDLGQSLIRINFHVAVKTEDRGPFKVRVEIDSIDPSYVGPRYFLEKENYFCDGSLVINISNVPYNSNYKVTCTIDGNLAYQSTYIDFGDLF